MGFRKQITLFSKPSIVQNFGQVGLKESQFLYLSKGHTRGAVERIKMDNVNKASSTQPGTLRLKNGRQYQYFMIITTITILLLL